MVTVTVMRKGGDICGMELDGHAEYAQQGDDLVCAAISSVAFAICNGMEKLAGVTFGYQMEDGYLYFVLPQGLDGAAKAKTQLLLGTLYLFLQELAGQYSGNVRVVESEV